MHETLPSGKGHEMILSQSVLVAATIRMENYFLLQHFFLQGYSEIASECVTLGDVLLFERPLKLQSLMLSTEICNFVLLMDSFGITSSGYFRNAIPKTDIRSFN